MGFYSRIVFPRLCDLLLNQPAITKLRHNLLSHAAGEILEIGFGTGLNLSCYPSYVKHITTVDPNAGMHELAKRRIRRSGIQVEHHKLGGEHLPFAADTFDCVVSTFTLCSIDGVEQALAEVDRVLKPNGHFLFLEHGLSPDVPVQKWQCRLNWLEGIVADGCRLTRTIAALVKGQFRSVRIEEFYLAGVPKTHGYLYQGVATK